ncbi:hypothetical protein ACFL0C_01915 [Patescibacteria group bacterium]
MNKLSYHLIQLHKETDSDEFGKLLSLINEMHGIMINNPDNEQNTAYLYYDKAPFQAKLKLEKISDNENLKYTKLPEKRIVLECEKTDHLTVNLIRRLLSNLEIRVYSPLYKCLLPKNLDIEDCTTFTSDNHEKAVNVIRKFNLEPVFILQGSYNYYAQSSQDQSVHFINDNLLYH